MLAALRATKVSNHFSGVQIFWMSVTTCPIPMRAMLRTGSIGGLQHKKTSFLEKFSFGEC